MLCPTSSEIDLHLIARAQAATTGHTLHILDNLLSLYQGHTEMDLLEVACEAGIHRRSQNRKTGSGM